PECEADASQRRGANMIERGKSIGRAWRRGRVHGMAAAVAIAVALVGSLSDAAPPQAGNGGAVSADEAKAVAEKRAATSEKKSANTGVQKLGKGPHGAMPVAEQLNALDKLALSAESAIPRGVDPLVWKALAPNDNDPTAPRIALGKKLYFDTRISKDGTL